MKKIYSLLIIVLFVGLLVFLVGADDEVIVREDSTFKEYYKGGISFFEVYSPRFNDSGIWLPINMTLIGNGSEYEINESYYKIKIKDNVINISEGDVELEFTLPIGNIIEVNENYIIYDISDSNYNASLKYTFNYDEVIKEIILWNPIDNTSIKKYDYEESYKSKSDKEFKKNDSIEGKIKIKEEGEYYDSKTKIKFDVGFSKTKFSLNIPKDFLENATFPVVIDPSLEISGVTTTLGGNLTYDVVTIKNNGVLRINSSYGYLNIIANYNFTLENGSVIQGYGLSNYSGGAGGGSYSTGQNGSGPGQGAGGTFNGRGGGGAGFAGSGGNGDAGASGGSSYSFLTNENIFIGSGGGGGGGTTSGGGALGGSGGASIKITSPDIFIYGIINMSGENGGQGSASAGEGGGGSAGEIILYSNNSINITGLLNVNGGNGGYYVPAGPTDRDGGGGSGGYIKIFYNKLYNQSSTLYFFGGWGYINGSDGLIYYKNIIPPTINITSPISSQTFTTQQNIPFTYIISDDENLFSNCYFNVTRGASIEIGNTLLPGCVNSSFNVSSDATYVLNVFVNDTSNNIDTDSVSFIVNTVPPGDGGGGGGGSSTTIIIGSNETDWVVRTTSGNVVYSLSMISGASRTRELVFKNIGDDEINLRLNCEGELCDYIEFGKTTLVLPPSVDIESVIEFDISLPNNLEERIYTSRIGAIDQNGNFKYVTLEINVNPFGIITSTLEKFRLNKDIFGIEIPYILLSIINTVLSFLIIRFIFFNSDKTKNFRLSVSIILSILVFFLTPIIF